MRRPLLLVMLAAVVTGCGNDVTRPPETRVPDPPRGTREVKLGDISFTAPFNWPDLQAEGQRIGGIQNKLATVAIWRYPRTEPLPRTRAALREVRDLLIARVTQRDATFDLRSSEVTRRGGARAIELVGRQTMAGLPYEVRSSHIFHDGTEIVVDAFSPPQYFERLDESVFVPLLDSLELKKR